MPTVKTTEQFIKDAIAVHGDKYDYSLVEYKHSKSKVIIICNIHNKFYQSPSSHLSGYGCNKCRYLLHSVKRTSNVKNFIEKSKIIHGNKYDYSLVEYKHSKSKVIIICNIHNKFYQNPSAHLNGSGCPICGFLSASVKNSLTTEEFIEKSKRIHGNKYDYGLVDYKNSMTKIAIICNTHGRFYQTPDRHLKGSGCQVCGRELKKSTTEEFIEKSKRIHDNKYNYSLVDYKNNIAKIAIICNIHGKFYQSPKNHIDGRGCSICGKEKTLGKQCFLYFIELYYNGKFYRRKVGITGRSIKIRFSKFKNKLSYKVLRKYKTTTKNAVSIEQYILKKFQRHKKIGDLLNCQGGGGSECFTKDLKVSHINKIINDGVPELSIEEIYKVIHHKK